MSEKESGTQYIKQGNSFLPTAKAAMDIHQVLPPGNYTIKKDPGTGQLFFDKVADFELPKKLYGNAKSLKERILTTFLDRTKSTGVLLTGEKGSGKTLETKLISIEAATMGIPTIIVNDPFCGDQFNQLLQSVTQPCIVLFDEFEKVYRQQDRQEAILTLLDGVFPMKKLFLFTCNDRWALNSHMTNRPGRIYYSVEYKGLDCNFVREYCEDNLDNKEQIGQVCVLASMFEQFNFDMLQAIVEEMNRYKEDPFEVVKMLNASPTVERYSSYTILAKVDGETLDHTSCNGSYEVKGNPILRADLVVTGYKNVPNPTEEDPEEYDHKEFVAQLKAADLVSVDQANGIYTYDNKLGYVVTFSRKIAKEFDMGSLKALSALY